ncbi:hypothetical protein Tco_0602907, partial [Tanacetum coccineum]
MSCCCCCFGLLVAVPFSDASSWYDASSSLRC